VLHRQVQGAFSSVRAHQRAEIPHPALHLAPKPHRDANGYLTLGEAKYLNPEDGVGFASVAKAKRFYAETNPAFEAAHPECSTIRSLVERL